MTKAKSKTKPITSTNYEGAAMTLVDEATFKPICVNDVRTMRGGEMHKITGGRAPHKPGSTGRVWTTAISNDAWQGEYFPAVVDATWMRDDTLAAHASATLDVQDANSVEAFERSGPRTFPHAEAPSMISAINKARQKARRAVRKVRS